LFGVLCGAVRSENTSLPDWQKCHRMRWIRLNLEILLQRSVLYCTALYCTTECDAVLYSTVLCCTFCHG
jgi:hypothetical protein